MAGNVTSFWFYGPGRLVQLALVLAACALGAVRPAGAQAVTATTGDPAAIARIRAEFAETQREAPTYRRTTRELQGYSLEGGELEGFYRCEELRMHRASHFGEGGTGDGGVLLRRRAARLRLHRRCAGDSTSSHCGTWLE